MAKSVNFLGKIEKMIVSNYKLSHLVAITAAAFVHGGIAAWSLMPSDPVVMNKQAIQISFVAPSANKNKNENLSHKKTLVNFERKNALRKKQEEVRKSEGKKNLLAGVETSGREHIHATATRAAESEPVFNASYLNNPAPYYPRLAKRQGVQGKVFLNVLVKADGSPAAVKVMRSSGSEELDVAALDAVKGWKFAPARSKGKAVQASVVVPVEFKII